jgi:hypothetical protein
MSLFSFDSYPKSEYYFNLDLIYNSVRNIITECLISVIMLLILDDYFTPDLIYNSVRNIITECLISVIMFLILNDSC